MSETLTKLVVDCATGEQTSVALTAEELSELNALRVQAEEAQALREAEETAKAEAKASAEAKLAALGLTSEEISALLA